MVIMVKQKHISFRWAIRNKAFGIVFPRNSGNGGKRNNKEIILRNSKNNIRRYRQYNISYSNKKSSVKVRRKNKKIRRKMELNKR